MALFIKREPAQLLSPQYSLGRNLKTTKIAVEYRRAPTTFATHKVGERVTASNGQVGYVVANRYR